MKKCNIILVVDDEEPLLNLLGSQIKHFGYEPILILDGVKAPDIFKENKDSVACIILDYCLIRITGYKLSILFRKIDPDVKIIVMSGYVVDDVDFKEIRIEGFLQKPFTIYELKTIIEKVIGD